MIRGYTREAGVRNLEREIGALCRKVARRRAEGDETPIEVTPAGVVDMLGAPKFLDEEMEERTKNPGVAIGLAWTPVGGEVLFIEASRMAGTGSLTLTGQLGDVMKESARAALSWLRTHARDYGIDPDFFKTAEMHVHVPSGRDPQGRSVGRRHDGGGDGLRAHRPPGARRHRDDRRDHALGRVLPVGGIKEKVLAARRVGIHEVILPKQNAKNVNEDLTPELRHEPERAPGQRDRRGARARAAVLGHDRGARERPEEEGRREKGREESREENLEVGRQGRPPVSTHLALSWIRGTDAGRWGHRAPSGAYASGSLASVTPYAVFRSTISPRATIALTSATA